MSVRSELIRGVSWTALHSYAGAAFQLVVTSILARIFSPEEFGLVALATVIIAFFNIFADMGLGAAIVQDKEAAKNPRMLNALFSLTALFGCILTGGFCLAAPLISQWYDAGETLTNVCYLLSIPLLLNIMSTVPNALLRKACRFRFIALRTLGMNVLGGVLAVTAALCGAGIYALVVAPIITGVGSFALNYSQYPLRFGSGLKETRRLWSYSGFVVGFGFVNYFSRNLDKLLVSSYFSIAQMGFYHKAYSLMMFPMSKITQVITPAMHPVLTTLQDDLREMEKKYVRLIIRLFGISLPIGLILALAADPIVHIVYGEQWDMTIPLFRILALSLPLQMIQSTTGSVYLAAGCANWQFYNGIINTCVTATGFLLATFVVQTITAVAWAWTITQTINFFTSMFLLHRCLQRDSQMLET